MSEYRSLRDSVWARAWNGGLTGPQLLVALRLVEHWPNIFPGEKTIARWTQLGVSTVRSALRELCAARIIHIERDPGRVNHYHFLDPDGRSIGKSFPDVGPTPPAPGAPPRQERADTPPGASRPTPPGASTEADPDPKQESKQEVKADPPRALLPHEVSEARKAARATEATGAQPVLRYQFPRDWNPRKAHLARALEIGLSESELWERVEDCRLKPIKQGFIDEDDHFFRELTWAKRDSETRKAKEQAYANRRDFETPGHARKR